MSSLRYKPKIMNIKCPDGTIKSFDRDDDEEEGWPEAESIVMWWLSFVGDKGISAEELSSKAEIEELFALQRLWNLYENELATRLDFENESRFYLNEEDPGFDPDDDPDDGEEKPIDLGDGANNEEFYPLDTRKVANEMLEWLIKMAGEFDRLGLTKEADKIDQIILKVASDQKASKKTYTNPETGKKNTVRYGQKGAKVAPGTSKGDSYCARSNGIKKALPASKRNDPNTPNNLSRKKWRCVGDKSTK